FFSYRDDDVGRLGELVGKLGGGRLLGSGIVDSVAGAVIALAIFFAWLGLGSFVVRFIPTKKGSEHSHVLELVIRVAVGAAVWSLIWFFLGIVGAYSPWIALAAVTIGLALNIFTFGRAREAADESRVPETANGFDRLLLLLIAVPVLLAFVASLAPPTAKDTLLYHFAVPKAFIAQGSSSFIEGNIAS